MTVRVPDAGDATKPTTVPIVKGQVPFVRRPSTTIVGEVEARVIPSTMIDQFVPNGRPVSKDAVYVRGSWVKFTVSSSLAPMIVMEPDVGFAT